MNSLSQVSMHTAVLPPVRSGFPPRTGPGGRPRRRASAQGVGNRGNRGGNAVRVKSNLLNGFNLIWVVQLSSQIYTASLSPQISGYFRAVPARQEGRIAIVTNARRDVVDAAASARRRSRRASLSCERNPARRTYGAEAYGKTVWSRHPW